MTFFNPDIVTNLADQYKLPLRATYNSLRGFHIQMITTANSSDTLPPVFIKITKQKNRLNFTTMDLVSCLYSILLLIILLISLIIIPLFTLFPY